MKNGAANICSTTCLKVCVCVEWEPGRLLGFGFNECFAPCFDYKNKCLFFFFVFFILILQKLGTLLAEELS